MTLIEKIQKISKIEAYIVELKSNYQGYCIELEKLREYFKKESNTQTESQEIACEINGVSEKQKEIEIKISFLEQIKEKILNI